MPSPEQPAEVGAGSGAESVGDGREEPDLPGGTPSSQRQWQRWTDEDWRLWNAGRWAGWSGSNAPSTGDANDDSGDTTEHASREDTSRRGTKSTDPWNAWKDPWNRSSLGSQRDDAVDERVGGASDKIVVPEFTGEEDKEGSKTRSYLRKIEAWRRVTRLKPNKQALVLYNGLTGKAWRDAEDLDVSLLDHVDGVNRFVEWITQRYLDKEVVKAGKYMSDFFKYFKRTPNQDIRDFNGEFDRHLSKLREVGCQLPGVCSSWWYVDKLRLDNTTELSLLSSVNNQYDLAKLQEAAVVQDRMNRRLWENPNKADNKHMHNKKNQQALCTEVDETLGFDEDLDDDETPEEEDVPDEGDTETHEAYVAFKNAKAKYNDVLKARGALTGKSKEEALQLAKARSYCSACGKKGHWHKDPECPKHKGRPQPGSTHTTHVVFYTDNEGLETIVDCACSRTLAGSSWARRYLEKLKQEKVPYIVITQEENFKFGGPTIYPSRRAIVSWLAVKGKWFMVKISVVAANVPLLLSRPVLASLGMHYKMEENMADFTKLGLQGVALGFTSTGHPRVDAVDFGPEVPSWPERVDWSVTEIHVPDLAHGAVEAYMASAASGGGFSLFYPKVRGHVHEMLTRDVLPPEPFLHWWREQTLARDFWIETEDNLFRIHITPRRTCFDPNRWNTGDVNLKRQLLCSLHEVRETTCIPCHGSGLTLRLEHLWQHEHAPMAEFLWIGRSRFRRRRTTEQAHDRPIREPPDVPADRQVAMEDEAGRAGQRAGEDGVPCPSGVDSTGVALLADREDGHEGGPESQDEGDHPHVLAGPDREVPGGGSCAPPQTDTGAAHEDAEGEHPAGGHGEGLLRILQGVHVQGGEQRVPGVGNAGGCSQPAAQPRSGPTGTVGTGPPDEAPSSWSRLGQWGSRAMSLIAGARGRIAQSQAEGQGRREEATTSGEDEADARGFEQLHHGVGPGDLVGGGDQGHGVSPPHLEGGQGGGEEATGRGTGGESQVQHSRTWMKKRIYWAKLKELHDIKKKMKAPPQEGLVTDKVDVPDTFDAFEEHYVMDEPYVPAEEFDAEETGEESDYIDLDEYDEFEETTGVPKVRLRYPVDYDEVKNLPSRRMRRTQRKRVKGLVHRALLCLSTTLLACATPIVAELHEAVVEPAKDLCKAVLGPNTFQGKREPVALLELFAGSAHLTAEFARRGYNVLEPRDILLGHDLFDPLQQESVFDDLNYKRPALLWVALPCTKWSQWQRLNFAQRKQQLRRERKKQRELVRFAVECAWNQIANGGEVMFEHPRSSDLWDDYAMEGLMDGDLMVYSDIDLCCYDLRATSDGGRLRKPTRIAASHPNLLVGMNRNCPGNHGHTPTEGRNTKAAGIYTPAFCRAVMQGFKAQERSVWVGRDDPRDKTWDAYAVNEAEDDEEASKTKQKMSGIELPAHVPQPCMSSTANTPESGSPFQPRFGQAPEVVWCLRGRYQGSTDYQVQLLCKAC